MAEAYLPRLVDGLISDLLVDLPGLLIVGPRASGKTTTARRHARSVVQLDQDVEAEQFRADPDVALAGMPEPVLRDEVPPDPPDLPGYVEHAVLGGYPDRVIGLPAYRRMRWKLS